MPRWKDVGTIAVETDGNFAAAVAKQRPLITRWAYEACNDFETNELLLDLDQPVELAWAVQPPKAPFWQKQPEIQLETVGEATAFDAGLRCGFLGRTGREYRGGGAVARYEKIVLGKAPEVPEARGKYWGMSGGPYGVKGIAKQREGKE